MVTCWAENILMGWWVKLMGHHRHSGKPLTTDPDDHCQWMENSLNI